MAGRTGPFPARRPGRALIFSRPTQMRLNSIRLPGPQQQKQRSPRSNVIRQGTWVDCSLVSCGAAGTQALTHQSTHMVAVVAGASNAARGSYSERVRRSPHQTSTRRVHSVSGIDLPPKLVCTTCHARTMISAFATLPPLTSLAPRACTGSCSRPFWA